MNALRVGRGLIKVLIFGDILKQKLYGTHTHTQRDRERERDVEVMLPINRSQLVYRVWALMMRISPM